MAVAAFIIFIIIFKRRYGNCSLADRPGDQEHGTLDEGK
jgi:hypothetical protein